MRRIQRISATRMLCPAVSLYILITGFFTYILSGCDQVPSSEREELVSRENGEISKQHLLPANSGQKQGSFIVEDMGSGIELIFYPELQQFDQEFDQERPSIADEHLQVFTQVWAHLKGRIAERVTTARLAEISRYAQTETAKARLQPGWIDLLPMKAIRSQSDGPFVLIGCSAYDSGASLPTSQPIVRRRIIIAAKFNRDTDAIKCVYVSIGGWVEE